MPQNGPIDKRTLRAIARVQGIDPILIWQDPDTGVWHLQDRGDTADWEFDRPTQAWVTREEVALLFACRAAANPATQPTMA